MDEETIYNQGSLSKIYKERAIYVGTFLGGPLVAGYLIGSNFSCFGEPDKVRKTWIYSILATIVIFGGAFLIPDSVKIPSQLIPIAYMAIVYFIVQRFQKEKIISYLNAGGKIHTWWRTIGVSIVGLAITVIPVFGIYYFYDRAANPESSSKVYGVMKHEIDFDKSNISEGEVTRLADAFVKTTFFDQEQTKYVYAKKIGASYELSISCSNAVTKSSEALEPFIQLRSDMQSLFPKNKIVLNLVVDNLENVVKRLE
jgi:hypothetical protein